MSGDATDKPDLSFVTNDELIDELMNRHDALFIVRIEHRTYKKSIALHDYSGGRIQAIGLAEYGKNELLKEKD